MWTSTAVGRENETTQQGRLSSTVTSFPQGWLNWASTFTIEDWSLALPVMLGTWLVKAGQEVWDLKILMPWHSLVGGNIEFIQGWLLEVWRLFCLWGTRYSEVCENEKRSQQDHKADILFHQQLEPWQCCHLGQIHWKFLEDLLRHRGQVGVYH